MPIYRYQCSACGATSEVLAKISDPAPETCPKCGGGPLAKAVARTAFHLKGGGWYAEGYGASGAGSSKGGSSESKPAESKPAESKPESKPAESKPAATPSVD